MPAVGRLWPSDDDDDDLFNYKYRYFSNCCPKGVELGRRLGESGWWWWRVFGDDGDDYDNIIIRMITIVVQRVLSLDDGSERAEERPRFKSWPFRCSQIRWSIVIVIIYLIIILNMLAYIIIIHLFYPINPPARQHLAVLHVHLQNAGTCLFVSSLLHWSLCYLTSEPDYCVDCKR